MHCFLFFQGDELLESTAQDTGSMEEEHASESSPDLLKLFSDSKKGWRKKPTTALRQEKQLRSLFAELKGKDEKLSKDQKR